MIKVNVITNNSRWNNFIKDPNKYINTKIKKFNSREKKFLKKSYFLLYFCQVIMKLKS